MEKMDKDQVRDQIVNGGGRMPTFRNKLNKQQVDEIIAYLFGNKNAKKGHEPNKNNKGKNEKEHLDLRQSIDTTMRYKNITAFKHFQAPNGKPAISPPYGTINAIDLNSGNYVWRRPLGNIPSQQKKGAPPTGVTFWGGPIVTKGGLIFIGGQKVSYFYVLDKKSGRILWKTKLPGPGYAIPATYMINGKQFVVITVSGSKEHPGGAMVAFSLP
jgi:quinoprotein glucose dehydrogenase